MDDKQREEQFVKGYNEGYLLSRYEPAVLKEVLTAKRENDPHFDGIKAGHKAHEKELFKKNLNKARDMGQRDKDRERD